MTTRSVPEYIRFFSCLALISPDSLSVLYTLISSASVGALVVSATVLNSGVSLSSDVSTLSAFVSVSARRTGMLCIFTAPKMMTVDKRIDKTAFFIFRPPCFYRWIADRQRSVRHCL